MGSVRALCISAEKGERKRPVPSAEFRAGHGIESDAHAGDWHRQVSLLAGEDVDAVRAASLPELAAGDFAENVVVTGIELESLGLGSRLRLGSGVELSITQIGKVCHTPCRIFYLTGDCIMPRLGLFARVHVGGTVRAGDAVEVLQAVSRDRYQAVVLTVSDRCSRGEMTDTAGPAVAEMLAEPAGFHVYAAEIIPDERDVIVQRLGHYCDGHSIDLVVTVGGTGFSPRDVTPEATGEVVERRTPGLDEAMRAASMAKTPRAMLSRAASGIRATTLIVNLPGSQRGATENLQAILPALAHGLDKLRGSQADCG